MFIDQKSDAFSFLWCDDVIYLVSTQKEFFRLKNIFKKYVSL